MSRWPCLALLALPALLACAGSHTRTLWHDTKLPSGKVVKVTSFNLVWGLEHDARTPADDCLAMEYVSALPGADGKAREAEAQEVFELARVASEQFDFRTATLAGFPSLERKGAYDFYVFTRGADGTWSMARTVRKVSATD